MRRWPLLLFVFAAGCRNCYDHVPPLIEQQIATIAPLRAEPVLEPCAATVPAVEGPLDLPALWNLALAHNPSLREAAAEVEAARGRLIQAGKYPNPHFVYTEDSLGSNKASEGNYNFLLNQEIVTGGKRRLDLAVASRSLDEATVALLGRKFDALGRIRRAYYEYRSQADTLRVNREVVQSLEKGLKDLKDALDKSSKLRGADVVRLQAVLDQARIGLARSQSNLDAAWKQLAAEVGVPELPAPAEPGTLSETIPLWRQEQVAARVQSASTELRQAILDADRARLEFRRARAEAIPNVTVAAGWGRSAVEETNGAIISIETPLPVWDRKQGRIHEARAKWEQAEAAVRTASARLSRDTAEAFARYEGARQEVERLTKNVLPGLEESLKLVRQGFDVSKDLSFLDVLDAVKSLNEARLKLTDARRELRRAVADLQGLMQLDLGEE
jgi:cobalt-zinc-cadmium efflux system outer membrane protein